MILLTSNSLNGRHRELNSKVNEAATQGVLFEEVKLQTEKSDVDRLYKIKLADKYRNVEYIIDTLKCGDDLYISKALKCAWICDEEFSNIINPDYLEKNVFPEMSFKMKRKLLTMISMHVTNDRAASFYTYCVQTKLTNIALKFLLNATEAFKVDVINGGNISFISDENMIVVIGKSFSVAVAVLDTLSKYDILKYLHNLRYLYSVSNVEYLDLVETYTLKHELTWEEHPRLGLRISRHILKNYKDRIISHTLLYINMLNKSMLVKYSRPDDVKNYALRLLPAVCSDFWSHNFCGKYNFLLELIPFQERLQYIKHIFTTRYPKEDFEMDIRFYEAGLYTLMTEEQRESWALKHVENELEHFGSGRDFLWYKFVSFEKAFVTIKKFILVSDDANHRNEMVRVLIHSAKSNRDLEILFDYYYKRFVNEVRYEKEYFVEEVFSNHKYFNFDDDCWNAFNKILHSMDVYEGPIDYTNAAHRKGYTVKPVIYSILHEKELHIVLKQYIIDSLSMISLKIETEKLPEEKAEVVYQYFFNTYLGKINELDINEFDAAKNNEMKQTIRNHISNFLSLMNEFNKPESEMPEIVKMYVEPELKFYRFYYMFREEEAPSLTQNILLKDLKTDASLVVSKISSVRTKIIADEDDGTFRLNKLLRKIRVYFSTEVATKYMELFKDLLISEDTSENTCNTAVYGIFQLAENDERIEFITKYIPTEPKIAHDEIKRKVLYIRKAVCKCVGMSRPVVSLVHVKKYIVGDYLKFCLPLMQSYAANLKPALFAEFVTFLLKSPASVQKHGIRLAFHCFNIKDLKEIISQTWDSTKNVSLRLVMYQAVHDKIIALSNEDLQTELFKIFNSFTLSLREDDDDAFFKVLCKSDLPHHILGEHIYSGWKALNHLPDKRKFNKYKCDVVNNMIRNVHLLQQDVLESIVSEHITFMLKQENIKYYNGGFDEHINNLIEAKWNLVAKYLAYLPNKAVLAQKIKIIQTIIKELVRLWDKIDNNVYIVRQFLKLFVDNIIDSTSFKDSCLFGISLLEEVLNELQEALPLIEIYDTVWSLRLSIIARNIILTVKDNIHDADVDDDNENDVDDDDADNKLIFNNCVDRFANEFIILFNEFIERGNYYLSGICIGTIISCVSNVASSLLNALPHIVNKNTDDIFLSICSKLVEIEKLETYYFALELLPQNYYAETSRYHSIVNKMKSFDNDEIRHFLYRKLVYDSKYECHRLNVYCNQN